METKSLIEHHKRSIQILEAIETFDFRSKHYSKESKFFLEHGLINVGQRNLHKQLVSEMAKKRMEQVYLNHIKNLIN